MLEPRVRDDDGETERRREGQEDERRRTAARSGGPNAMRSPAGGLYAISKRATVPFTSVTESSGERAGVDHVGEHARLGA